MKNKVIISIIIAFTVLMSVFTGYSLAGSLGKHGEGLNNVKSNGASAVGNTVTARYSDMQSRDDLYCVMHGKALKGNVVFSVNQYIKIDGNKATNQNGNTVTSIENGILAYILHTGEGYGSNGNYTRTQKGVYGTINNWYDAVGSKLGVNSAIKYYGNNTYKNYSLIAEATEYAKKIVDEKEVEVKDNTDKSNIKVTAYANGDEGFIRVGPFNWSFEGKIISATVYGDNNNKIPNVRFSTFRGTQETFYNSTEDIQSGKNFYITLKVDSGFTKIGKIVAKHQIENQTIYTAELWFLKHTSLQNLMLTRIGSYESNPKPIETPFEYDIDLTKDIEIVKIDSVKTDKKLPNVKFILKHKEAGKYIKQAGNKYTFVNDKKDATEFKTGSDGKVVIKNVPIGTYYAYEVENPNKGYEIKETATIIGIKEESKNIKNKYHLGEFELEKVDKDYTNKKLEGVEFTLLQKTGKYAGKYVGVDGNGIAVYSDNKVTIKTDSNGKLQVKELWEGTYSLTEVNNPNYGYLIDESNINIEISVSPYNTTYKTITNQYHLGEIDFEKIDKDHPEIKLKEVEFTLKALDVADKTRNNKYVEIDQDGNAKYVDNEVRVKTDDKGKLHIEKVWEGKYLLTEVNNPNYGYIIDPDSQNIEITVKHYETLKRDIKNEQYYIRLSGFIWQDMNSDKTTTTNDYYKTNGIPSDYVDDQDIEKCNGITVRLKRISDDSIVYEGKPREREFTNKEQITTSSERGIYDEIDGGEYVFEYVRVKELSDYYVEFEYDGVIYKSVVANINHNYGSKADDKVDRNILDNNFATVDGTGENKVNVNNKYTIDYNETVDHRSSIKYIETQDSTIKNLSYSSQEKGLVNAKTKDAECDISKYFTPGNPDIKYINLGLYEKPQSDIALAHDLDNVNVGVNGYWHVYKYGARKIEQPNADSWNVGVKFRQNGKYKRPIYRADMTYEDPTDKSQNLQVMLTYKIALNNESSYFTRVNQIADYFDSNYEIVAVGTDINTDNIGKLTITGNLNCSEVSNHNGDHKKVIINANSMIQPGETKYVYIQFRLDKSAVLKIMNNQETLYTRAEISSYTICKDENGNSVAVLDHDSVPGSIDKDITNIEKYEDDTDSAPPVQLELANARSIYGNVFLDNTSGELKVNQTRNGNGIFDNGETPIPGVKVVLHELDNSIPDIVVDATDENGYYSFSEFVPGKYTITYIWGDKTYTVQNYKGTIYNNAERQNRIDVYNNPWYKDGYPSFEPRYSDAMDDYNLRKQIDEQIASLTDRTVNDQISAAYEDGYTGNIINKMNSTTPTMEFSVEYETVETDGTADKVEFIIKNIDFGIAERARQKLDMTKRVKAFTIVLANGQIIADVTIDENGNMVGEKRYVTYMGPSVNNGYASRGYVKAEIDNELIQGATLKATYEIKIVNNSEIDYISENYYKYGIEEGPKATLIPSVVVDFLDRKTGFDQENNPDWQYATEQDVKDLNVSKIDNNQYINSALLLKTEATKKALEPAQSVSVDLNVSKLLTASEEMTFKNDSETAKVEKHTPGGSPVITTTEDDNSYPDTNPEGKQFTYIAFSSAEDMIIVPSTGDNKEIVLPIITTISALTVLGIGIISIKKFVLNKNKILMLDK